MDESKKWRLIVCFALACVFVVFSWVHWTLPLLLGTPALYAFADFKVRFKKSNLL